MKFKVNEQFFIKIGRIIFWYKNGVKHRDDGPASIYSSGTKIWYQHGELHREDGPAVETYNGNKYWYKNGKYMEIAEP